MRIADSTVNMLSGRNYKQTGMRSGDGYTNSFIDMVSTRAMNYDLAKYKDKNLGIQFFCNRMEES